MMTEAEALETLAREDPAVAADARAALRWLTSGGGLEVISQLRLQEFLWHVLPTSWPLSAAGQLAVARALGRLLTLAGLERYAGACASGQTEDIIAAYDQSPGDGVVAYSRAVEESRVAPPDTDLLAWGSARGHEEQAAYEACAAAIELAIAAGDLKAGASGWKTKRSALVDRWLMGPDLGRHPDSGSDTLLGKISAERIDEWAHGHPGERARMARRIVPRLLEPPVLPGEPLPALRWLLQHADAGLPLTARHYIAPAAVSEAMIMFGWGEVEGQRCQELSVDPLHTLRSLAQREMGAVRRSGARLLLTRTGRLMADDPGIRWHIGTSALIGPDDGPDPDFTVAVREAALLIIALDGSSVARRELIERLVRVHTAEGWTSRSGRNVVDAMRFELGILSQRLQALQLLDPDSAPGEIALTPTGVAAALSALLARALRPRHG
ncbi:MAG TPA: hypothetical protein VH478_21680 [Trebonia sp.]|jgi:hypothetical protein|nr:hypothetical protein [Trebonia sp.]